ncbi:hypothetical protein AFCDBAGC_3818 [Methylobacterium cerastii]|uniref:Uncharacterized protein n=1 Tax=Methylobacterium cerastii TaxID=932741 RepID=A0ABQ4QMA5_9HYPH|nr:hypothetical protein AFCDBAGC_3818 [Methylobacterium cerastii]
MDMAAPVRNSQLSGMGQIRTQLAILAMIKKIVKKNT